MLSVTAREEGDAFGDLLRIAEAAKVGHSRAIEQRQGAGVHYMAVESRGGDGGVIGL